MKIFTSLHDTLQSATDHIQLSPKRLQQASTMMSEAQRGSTHQAPEPKTVSVPKRLRKRRRSPLSPKAQDEPLAINVASTSSGVPIEETTPLEESEFELYRLASQHFSKFDPRGTVLKASQSLPRIPFSPQLSPQALSKAPPLARKTTVIDSSTRTVGYRHPSLYFSAFDAAGEVLAPLSQPQIVSLQSTLGERLWTKAGSVDHTFLQDCMSVETLHHIVYNVVPSLLARKLSDARRDTLEFMSPDSQQPQLGSWEHVLEHFSRSVMEESNGTHTWIPHRILPRYHADLQHMRSEPVTSSVNISSLEIISEASARRPTTLVIKQTHTSDVDSEVSFFSFSKGSHITVPQPPSLDMSPAGWSRLEELALDCFISDADAIQLFNDCKSTLRTAVLNLHKHGAAPIVTTNAAATQMSVLSSLTITSSLPLEPLAFAFTFPALRELSLTAVEYIESDESPALGIFQNEPAAKLSSALRFPWANLAKLALRNSTCDAPRVEDILARCSSLTSFTWKDRYSMESQPQAPPIMLPLLEELTIDASECGPLLHSIARSNSCTIKKLALHCCDDKTVNYLPEGLSELVVQEPMVLGTCANALERLGRALTRGTLSVRAGKLDPCQGPIHMRALRRIHLQGEVKSVQILHSLINAPNLRERSK